MNIASKRATQRQIFNGRFQLTSSNTKKHQRLKVKRVRKGWERELRNQKAFLKNYTETFPGIRHLLGVAE